MSLSETEQAVLAALTDEQKLVVGHSCRIAAQARATLMQTMIKRIAIEAFTAWDSDKDMRVGKILRALSGEMPGYRADIDALLEAATP